MRRLLPSRDISALYNRLNGRETNLIINLEIISESLLTVDCQLVGHGVPALWVGHAAGVVAALELLGVLQTEVSIGQDLVREVDPLVTGIERVRVG